MWNKKNIMPFQLKLSSYDSFKSIIFFFFWQMQIYNWTLFVSLFMTIILSKVVVALDNPLLHWTVCNVFLVKILLLLPEFIKSFTCFISLRFLCKFEQRSPTWKCERDSSMADRVKNYLISSIATQELFDWFTYEAISN
jgi:hypothetical protein